MAVIKQTDASNRAEVFSLGDIAVEAKGIISRAQRQAEQIVAGARKSAETLRAEARQGGQQEGFAAGQQEGQKSGRDEAIKHFDQQIARTGRALAEAIEQLADRKGRMLAEARQDLVALALAVAEKVVRRGLAGDPEACRRSVDAAVELAGRASRLSVRISPADLETIRAFAGQLGGRLTGQGEIEVIGDETIEPGGCKVTAWRETGLAGEIDATIQTQVERIAAELLGKEEA